jgi:hypothetical protein
MPGGSRLPRFKFVNFLFQALKRGKGLLLLLQQDDAQHDVWLAIAADLSQSRLETLFHLAQIAHQHGSAVPFGDDDGADVIGILQ